MSVIRLDGECTCTCHQANSAITLHLVCCEVCPWCNRRIVKDAFKRHVKRCPQKPSDPSPDDKPPETAA